MYNNKNIIGKEKTMLFGKYVNRYYKVYFWQFFFGILALIFVDVIQLFIPEITGRIIDLLTTGSATLGNFKPIIINVVYIALIGAGMFVGRLLWRICILGEAVGIQTDLRHKMFLKASVLTQRYYKANKTGAILAYFSNDLETIEEVFGFGLVQFVDGVFLLVLSLVKMFMVQPVLTAFCLIPLLLLIVAAVFLDRAFERTFEKRQKAFENLSDFAQENFTGIRVIKAFVKEKHELKKFSKEAKKNKDAEIKFVRLDSVTDMIFNVLIYTVFAVVLFGGSYFVYKNITTEGKEGLSIGKMVEFIGYLDTIIWPIFALAGMISLIARGRTSLKRISSFLDEEVEIKDEDNPQELSDVKGKIEFKNFNFAYPDAPEKNVLKDISFVVEEGETIGIVGKIGSGKTTLVNMLFRLFNVEKGTLFIDDQDIMDSKIKDVRASIGYCPQDNFLFSDSIRANISFGGEFSDEEIKAASEFSAVRDNIESFNEGFDTVIGENGVTLSGGQKQRISISRAFIKNPSILILDDSVSAVDVKTEETILSNIKEYRKGKTTIIIASRVSTVKGLDKILVLNDGTIDAYGSHEECLLKSAVYAKMVELQALEKELENK